MKKGKYKKLYETVYDFAYEVYVERNGKSKEQFESEFKGWNPPKNLKDVYKGFIASAQNGSGKSKIINFKDREKQIKKILFEYDIKNIVKKYSKESLLKQFNKSFEIKNLESKQNSWRIFSKACIDSAFFLSRFKSLTEFDNFVKYFDKNEHTRVALPLYLSTYIDGYGFALSCDVLKELNYVNFGKPDTHTKDFYIELGLIDLDGKKKEDIKTDIKVFNEMQIMAKECKVSTFEIDKVIWLSCARDYGGHKNELIDKCKKIIN